MKEGALNAPSLFKESSNNWRCAPMLLELTLCSTLTRRGKRKGFPLKKLGAI